MADDIIEQLNSLANSLPRGEGKSTAYGAAAEIIRLRNKIVRLCDAGDDVVDANEGTRWMFGNAVENWKKVRDE